MPAHSAAPSQPACNASKCTCRSEAAQPYAAPAPTADMGRHSRQGRKRGHLKDAVGSIIVSLLFV